MAENDTGRTLTDRQLMFVAEKFRRLQDRLTSARAASPEVGYDILGRLIEDAKALRKTLVIAKRGGVNER